MRYRRSWEGIGVLGKKWGGIADSEIGLKKMGRDREGRGSLWGG